MDDDLALLEQATPAPRPKGSRVTWSAEIVDEEAFLSWNIPCNGFMRNGKIYMPALNAIARQQKSLMKIPGVRAVSKRSS